MADARFEDGAERPLKLVAMDAEGLQVIAALAQDAVFTGSDLSRDRKRRQFGLLLNRFRWEDRDAAQAEGRAFERVRAALVFDGVLSVQTLGIRPGDDDTILSLLSIDYAPTDEVAGTVTLVLAGDGAIRLQVESLEVALRDVTRPYRAVSGRAPDHDLDHGDA